MRMIRGRTGQSTAEYAVLFAIVIGAAIAMQQYIKARLQGASKAYTDGYVTAASVGGTKVDPFEPTVLSSSQSGQDITMEGAKSGAVVNTGGSRTGKRKSVD